MDGCLITANTLSTKVVGLVVAAFKDKVNLHANLTNGLIDILLNDKLADESEVTKLRDRIVNLLNKLENNPVTNLVTATTAVNAALTKNRVALKTRDLSVNVSEMNNLQLFDPDELMFHDGILSLSFLSEVEVKEEVSTEDFAEQTEREDAEKKRVEALDATTKDAATGKTQVEQELDVLDKDTTEILDKARADIVRKRKGAKGMTYSKIVANLFPGNSELASEMMKLFQYDLVNTAVLDKYGYPVLASQVPDKLKELKEQYKKLNEQSSGDLEFLKTKTWKELQDYLLTKATPAEKIAYKALIAYATFDVLLNAKQNYGGLIKIDKDGNYTVNTSKSKGKVQTTFLESDIVAMGEMDKITSLILSSTYQQNKTEYGPKTNSHITFTEEITLPTLSKNAVSWIASMKNVISQNANIEDIVDFMGRLAESEPQNAQIQAINNRYFSRTASTVNTVYDGPIKRMSLYAVYLKGLGRDGETGAFTQDATSRAAQEILTEFTSSMLSNQRVIWLSMNINGNLDINDAKHTTDGMLNTALDKVSDHLKFEYGSIKDVSDNMFTINIDGDDKVFNRIGEGKNSKWKPVKSLSYNEYDQIMRKFNIGTGSGFARNFILSTEVRDSSTGASDPVILNTIIGNIIRAAYLNNINLSDDFERYAEFGINEKTYNKTKITGNGRTTYPVSKLVNGKGHIIRTLNNARDINTTLSTRDSEGNKKSSVIRALALTAKFKEIRKMKVLSEKFHYVSDSINLSVKTGKTPTAEDLDTYSRNHSANVRNPYVRPGGFELHGYSFKNKVGIKSHMDTTSRESMNLNMSIYFQGAKKDNFQSSHFDFMAPSDAPKYPVAHVTIPNGVMVSGGSSFYLTEMDKDKKLVPKYITGEDYFVEEYYKNVAENVQEYEKDFYASWLAEIVLIAKTKGNSTKVETDDYKAATDRVLARMLTTKNYSEKVASNLISQDDDYIREELAAMYKERFVTKYVPAKLKTYVLGKIASLNITGADARESGLLFNRDYVLDGKDNADKPNTELAFLNEGLLKYFDIHSSLENVEKQLKAGLTAFVESLKTLGIESLSATDSRIISDRYEADVDKGKRVWANGDITKDGVVNPGIISYFYQWNTVSQSLMHLNSGLVFDYDAKDKTDLRAIMSSSFIAQAKRNKVLLSEYHQPILHKVDEFGTPVDASGNSGTVSTRLLAEEVTVAYFDDIKLDITLLSNGQTRDQDIYDGGIFIHPLELKKYAHSYGGQFTPLHSQIIKSIITNYNPRRGYNQPIKMAMHQITSEMSLNSRKNGAVDMHEMLRKMMDRPFAEPVRVAYTSEYDQNISFDREFSSLLEIFDALGKDPGDGTKNGFYNENVWEDLLEIEFQFPAVANKYVGILIPNTSVKSGQRQRNKSLLEVSNDPNAKLITSKMSNRTMGIQLNADHDVDDNESSISSLTQVANAAVNEQRSQKEASSLFDTIAEISKYRIGKLKELYNGDLLQAAKDELLQAAYRDDEFDGVLEMLTDPNWDYNDPALDRKLISKLNTIVEKASIRLRLNGGKLVVTPVSNMYMLYVLPNPKYPENIKYNPKFITMNRMGYEKYIIQNKEFAEKHGLDVNSTAAEIRKVPGAEVRNLKWNSATLGEKSNVVLGSAGDNTFRVDTSEKGLFTVEPIQAADKKAVSKAKIATKYLGFSEGISGSSTDLYSKQAGIYANTGLYTNTDVVFASFSGKRGGDRNIPTRAANFEKAKAELNLAIAAGATILTDNAGYLKEGDYNEGEWNASEYLKSKGMSYTEVEVDGHIIGAWKLLSGKGKNVTDTREFKKLQEAFTNKSAKSNKREFTPDNITELKSNQVFVFGANTAGGHGGGTAGLAQRGTTSANYTALPTGTIGKWAEYGIVDKLMQGTEGKSFGLVTKDASITGTNLKIGSKRSVPLSRINQSVDALIAEANNHPELEFLVTKFGTNMAGFTIQEMKSLLENKQLPDNIILPEEFEVRKSTKADLAYSEALAAYNQMLNDEAADVVTSPGEVLLPMMMKEKYNLKDGDSLSDILSDVEFFYRRHKESLTTRTNGKKQLRRKADGTPASLSDFYGKRIAANIRNEFIKLHYEFKQSLEGVLPRVPTSGKQSVNSFVIAGFLNSLNNAVGIPIESMVVKGEDLDIDAGYAMMRIQDSKGFIFQYFTHTGYDKTGKPSFRYDKDGNLESKPGDTPLTKAEIRKYFPKMYITLERKYMNTRWDWYEKGLENLMIDNYITIFQSAKNIIEANTATAPEMLRPFNKIKPKFSIFDPTSTVIISTENRDGKNMVSVMASSSKAASAITRSFQEDVLSGKLGDTNHLHTGVNIDGVIYNTIANVSSIGLFDNYYDTVNKGTQHQIKAKEALVKSGVFTEVGWDNIEAQLELVRKAQRNTILKEHSWENYSHMINAATDNAKELILASINANTITGTDISTMILLGVPLVKIFDIFTSKDIVDIVKVMRNSDIGYSLSTYIVREQMEIPIFKELAPLSKEFQLVLGLTGINQGNANDSFGMYKYGSKVNLMLANNNINTTLFKFVNASNEEQQRLVDGLGMLEDVQLNVLNVIRNNPHYMQFIKMAAMAKDLRNENLYVDRMADSALLESNNTNVTEILHQNMHNAVQSDMIFRFLKNKKFNFMGTVHSFTTEEDVSNFATFMVWKLPEIIADNPDNKFLEGLTIDRKKHDMSDTQMEYISSQSFKKASGDDRLDMRGGANKLDKDTKLALFYYSLIMSASNMYTDNFSGVFDLSVRKKLNEFRANFASTYNTVENSEGMIETRKDLYYAIINLSDDQYINMPFAEVAHQDLFSRENIALLEQKFIDLSKLNKKPKSSNYAGDSGFDNDNDEDTLEDNEEGVFQDNSEYPDQDADEKVEDSDSSKVFKIKTYDQVTKKHVYMSVAVTKKKGKFKVEFKLLQNKYPNLGAPYRQDTLSRENFNNTYYPDFEGEDKMDYENQGSPYGDAKLYVPKVPVSNERSKSTESYGADGKIKCIGGK